MRTNDFIETPIHTQSQKAAIDYDRMYGWEKRARKLQDRRWRKMASRLARSDTTNNHFKPRHRAF